MGTINIRFPNSESYEFVQGKPIVFLGANGSGKTRLGVEIEKLNDRSFSATYDAESLLVQRISAQKSLSISEAIQILGYEASERNAYVGNYAPHANKLGYKYGSNPATYLLNDYDSVLSLFFAKNNRQLEKQHELDREASERGQIRPPLIKTYVEQAKEIWDYLLPNRTLDLSGNEVHAIGFSRYHGKEMSDGERVILYMILQAISLKPNSVLIIDEPELHIHKAILNKLWDKLEKIRADCVFVYITHDLDFAVSRNTDKILWVKSFDGNTTWEYEFIDSDDFSELPEELLYEIIGTRKKVLFVEGTKSSLDYHLYQEIYKDKSYHVIPCGGCQQVINYVKAKRGYSRLNAIDAIGVIDRDYRTEEEIQSLRQNGVFPLDVAEVENLFIVPELLDVMSRQMGCDAVQNEEAKKLIRSIYSGKREMQVGEAFTKEVDFQMGIMHFEDYQLSPEEIKRRIDEKFTLQYIAELSAAKRILFFETDDIKAILRVFNCKELSNKVGAKFGCKHNEYPRRVIRLLRSDVNGSRQQIIEAVQSYLPILP